MDGLKSPVLLWSVRRDEHHHSGVRVIFIVQRPNSNMSQNPIVARAASNHCPEQIIIASNLVFSGKLTEDNY